MYSDGNMIYLVWFSYYSGNKMTAYQA